MSPEPRQDDGPEVRTQVDGHVLTLRRLDKVLYPQTGTTKGEVLDYYARVAPHLLVQAAGRPVTRKRWPHGVEAEDFFEKNVPRGAPSWLRTVRLETPGSSRGHTHIDFPVISSTAELVYLAHLASLELHTPQWTVGPRGGVRNPDRLVIDLDPGAPAGLGECAEVALLVRERLRADGLEPYPVTSGSKGLQLYAEISADQGPDAVVGYARALADELAAGHRRLVTSTMSKAARPRKVFIDWSQNNPAKTTVTPYSLRGRAEPWVAAPRSWAEIEDAGSLRQLRFEEVLERLAGHAGVPAPAAPPVSGDGPRLPSTG